MRLTLPASLLACTLLAFFGSPAIAGGPGLYGNEGKDIKTGDVDSQDYWWTKWDMMMLDLAIKQHQPEGRIAVNLASTTDRLKSLEKEYPSHEGIKEWKKKVEDVNSKINPDANRGESFKPGCPWDESNFAQAWVNYHWAKMELADKKEDEAFGLLQNVKQNLEIMLKPDRMKDYPEDLKKWAEDAKPEVDKMYAELKDKTHH